MLHPKRLRRAPVIVCLAGLCLTSVACSPAVRAPESESVRARRIHERVLTLDTHLDTPIHFGSAGWDIMQRHAYGQDLSQVDYPRLLEGGLDGGFWAVFTPQGPRTPEGDQDARTYALKTAQRITGMVAAHPAEFELALRADDAQAIAARGKRVVFLSVENAYPLGTDLSVLTELYALGVRMLGLVHTLNNDFADSSTDAAGKEWSGLSPKGRAVVEEANRLGMIVDASHGSDDMFDQLLELSRTPIILSHSGCSAVFVHPRNVDDARLQKLAKTGGVIQMNALGSYLTALPVDPQRESAQHAALKRFGPLSAMSEQTRQAWLQDRLAIDRRFPPARATLDDFMKHVLHALKLVGPEHVGIGADWDGGGGVVGMEDVASVYKISERLLAEGYSEADLGNIWSGNVLRLLRAAEAHVEASSLAR